MYGAYDYSIALERAAFKLDIKQRGNFFVYQREVLDNKVEKILGPGNNRIIVHPIEPVTRPKELTRFLEITFNPVFIDPESEKAIYLKFPVEIGVFITTEAATEIIDSFSFNIVKYSLYGTPRSGVITRWFKSETFSSIPRTDPMKEGILHLIIDNPTKEFTEVSKVILDASRMALYFGDFVSTKAKMTIISSKVAETRCIDDPLENGMKKALELFKTKRLPVMGKYEIKGIGEVEFNVFLMEWELR